MPHSTFRTALLATALASLAFGGCRQSSATGARGLVRRSAGASEGYVLFTPILSATSYLVDTNGEVVHTWETPLPPGASAYLLENGDLLRSTQVLDPPGFPGAGGGGGAIQQLDWSGRRVWRFTLPSELLQHHDLEPLPNGNVLLIAHQSKTRSEALAVGRLPNRVGARGLWPDCVLELEPVPPDDAKTVWQWCMWDHLVQDVDPELPGYGFPAEHPELVDINGDRHPQRMTEELLRQLKAIGYVSPDATPRSLSADFVHTNSVAYHPTLDQIVLSVPRFNEIWIIDHSTSTAEAAGHDGGRSRRGGDLLYRWGNPMTYGRGSIADKRLFSQHDARWIPQGFPGAGNITIFNNGLRRSSHAYSSVLEIVPPRGPEGDYLIEPDEPFGPKRPIWQYTASPRHLLFAEFISGAHRMANGNTLITDGPRGRIMQVTPRGEVVWIYDNPFSGNALNPDDNPPWALFRATFIPPGHPGLAGRTLVPLDPQPVPDARSAE